MKKPRTPESAVLRACLSYLAVRGIRAWRNNSGLAMFAGKSGKPRPVRFGKQGQADILGYMPDGRFVAVECKASDGKATPDQEEFLADVRRAGGVAILARSLDELIAGLEAANRKKSA